MKHIVTFSNALVITTLDDSAEVISITAFPLSIAFWLPCWLYMLLSHLAWQVSQLPAGIRMYISGWRDDLRLMASAVNEMWTGCPAWAVGAG